MWRGIKCRARCVFLSKIPFPSIYLYALLIHLIIQSKVNYNFSNLSFPIRKTVSLSHFNDNLISEMDMNNMQKTPEQQIDEVVESLKALLLPQARNLQEADEIKRRLDSLGHEAKAVSAIVNDRDIYKAAIHKILSQMR